MKALRNNQTKIFLTVLLLYMFYISPAYLNANTNRFIVLTKSIVDDKTFAIDKYYETTCDRAFYKGHYYTGAAPGMSFLAAPIYFVLKPFISFINPRIYENIEFSTLNLFFTFFLSILPGAALSVLLYNILSEFKLKEKEKLLIVFTSSFGTLLFFYSTRFFAHVMSAFLMFSAFYILFKFKNQSKNKYVYFWAGLFLGMAVLCEYTQIIGAALFAFYAFFNFKKEKIQQYFLFVFGLLLTIIVFAGYHYVCFDSPVVPASAYSIKLGSVPFSMVQPKMISALTFGTYKGIFMYMPILLISLYGIFVFYNNKERKYVLEMTLTCLYAILMFLIVNMLANHHWPWGGSFGPRYFLCLIPFLIIPTAFAFRKISYKIILGIAILSILINWCGVQYGDADSVFTNVGLFIFMGLNSNLAAWLYYVINTYVRNFNVITHFSPLLGFLVLLTIVYVIWKKEIDILIKVHFCDENNSSRTNVR